MATTTVIKGGLVTIKTTVKGGAVMPMRGGSGGSATLQSKSVSYTPTTSAQTDTVIPDSGYDGLSDVNVTVNAVPEASEPYISWININDDGTVEADIEITSGGYIESGTTSPTTDVPLVSVKGAQTYTPGNTDQTIAAWQYLTGVQTIKGDANLLAENIVKGVSIFGVTGTAETGGAWVEQTIATNGAVTQALDANTLYHFTGNLTSLTITLNAAEDIAHYHFDFLSGSTAPTLTLPRTVTMPDDFSVEAGKRYEIDILNDYGTVVEWTSGVAIS